MEWFRHKHGLSTDAKLAFAAKRCGMHRAFAVMLWSYLLEKAATTEDRGSVAGVDRDEAAFSLDLEREQVDALVAEFHARGLLVNDRVFTWDRHNLGGSNSSERVRLHRERKAIVSSQEHETFPTEHETLQAKSATFPGNTPVTSVKHAGNGAVTADFDLGNPLNGQDIPDPSRAGASAGVKLTISQDTDSSSEEGGPGEGDPKPARLTSRGKPLKRCPSLDDLQLDDELVDLARREGRDAGRELDRYKSNCQAKAIRFKDYRAGFRNWLTSPYGRPLAPAARGQPGALPVSGESEKFLRSEAKDQLRKEGHRESDDDWGELLGKRMRLISNDRNGTYSSRP